jgi:hypothetical protein
MSLIVTTKWVSLLPLNCVSYFWRSLCRKLKYIKIRSIKSFGCRQYVGVVRWSKCPSVVVLLNAAVRFQEFCLFFFTKCIRETHEMLNKVVHVIIYVYLEPLTCAFSLKIALLFLRVWCVLIDSVTTNVLIICTTQADKSCNPTVNTNYMLLQKLVIYLPNYKTSHPRGP